MLRAAAFSFIICTKASSLPATYSAMATDITHNTARGSTPFTLSSTNKLLKQYPYTTGLKTGSTSSAKYCLSATANKENLGISGNQLP